MGSGLSTPEELVGQMTLTEKASLLVGDSAWTTTPIPRLGLPSIRLADGPHGVRRTGSSTSMAYGAHPATCFPTASCTSASWDPELVHQMGRAIAREARALDVDVVLGPGANMKRSPLCGRNFEYFSEDPYLAGRLASAWIDGVQSLGVGASLKHFAVNNQETRRMTVSAEVDERTLRETYLPAFETAVQQSRPWTVMCAYNRVNGVHASEHHWLLTDVLRTEWGFDGVVVSDWGAVHDRPAALAAGLDLEMPGPRPRRVAAVVDAVQAGTLEESVVDEACLRMLRMVLRATTSGPAEAFDPDEHHALARRIASEGMVLLRNDGLLPLSPGGRIAVIGRAALEARIQGGGSSQITPTQVDRALTEITRLAGDAEIAYAEGYDDERPRPELIAEAASAAERSDVAIVIVAMPAARESEGADRTDLELAPAQVALIQAVTAAQPRTVVVLMNGSAVGMDRWINGTAAVLEAWYAGQAAGGAIADILFGEVDPGGRLAETFPLRIEDTPAYLDFPGELDHVRYGEGRFIGYRWYDARCQPVLFPFGHGLSYTTFEYQNVHATVSGPGATDGVDVAVDLTNTGQRAGCEVIQVYIRGIEPKVPGPDKQLCGFSKVRLAAGETRTVRLHVQPRAFARWDPGAHAWATDAGDYELLVGSSSADLRGSITVTIAPDADVPSALTPMSPLGDWLRDPRGRDETLALLRTLRPILGEVFDEAVDDHDGLGPHVQSYFGTMPMQSLLEFAAPSGGPDPDARVAAMMQTVTGEETVHHGGDSA